jgi:hypothetical protein
MRTQKVLWLDTFDFAQCRLVSSYRIKSARISLVWRIGSEK